MNSGAKLESGQLPLELQALATDIRALAQSCKGDSMAILALLRALEALHQEIRDGLFQESLPDSRQALYALLKDVEAESGWPYIPRKPLRSLLVNLTGESEGAAAPETPESPPTPGSEPGSRL